MIAAATKHGSKVAANAVWARLCQERVPPNHKTFIGMLGAIGEPPAGDDAAVERTLAEFEVRAALSSHTYASTSL
jgi:hypothetical protein